MQQTCNSSSRTAGCIYILFVWCIPTASVVALYNNNNILYIIMVRDYNYNNSSNYYALPDRDLSTSTTRRRRRRRHPVERRCRARLPRETDQMATNTRGAIRYTRSPLSGPKRQTNKSRTYIIIIIIMFNPPIPFIHTTACCSYRREILLNTRPGALQKRGWPHTYQPPDTTIINNNNNRYSVICVYTRVGVTYIILLLYYIVYIYYTCDRVQ